MSGRGTAYVAPAHQLSGRRRLGVRQPSCAWENPYWGQSLMRTIIRPAVVKIGNTKHIGWHIFRHTYSSLLRANRTDIKVTQKLLRHASSRVTLDTYTQVVTIQKRKPKAMLFVFCMRPVRLLDETRSVLAPVPSLCLYQQSFSTRKHW